MMGLNWREGLHGNGTLAACGIAAYFALVSFARLALEQGWPAGASPLAAFLEPSLGVSFGVWSIILGFRRDFGEVRSMSALLLLSAACFIGFFVVDELSAFRYAGFLLLVVSAPRLFLESCKALVSLEASRMSYSALAGIVGFRFLRVVVGFVPASVSPMVGILTAATLLCVSAWGCPLSFGPSSTNQAGKRTPTLWLMVGLIVMGVVFGAMKGVIDFGGHGLPISLNGIGLGLSVALLLLLLLPKKTNGLVSMYRATAFLALVGLCTFALDGGAYSSFAYAMVLTSQQLLLCLVWIVAPTVSFKIGERECEPFGWCFVVFYLSSGISLLVCSVISIPESMLWFPPLASLLGITFFLFLFKESDLREHLDIHEVKLRSEEEYLEEVCERIASQYSLSNREGEILPYWIRGMQAAEIGETLYVSENTVRSHIHHIYTKTGTHSRRELQKLMEG